MIAKAIVVEVINEYNAKIRIPIFDKIEGSAFATTNDNLRVATICCPPGCKYALKKDDVVFVGFELDNLDNPIILGMLSVDSMQSSININSQSLKVNVNCELPNDTKLGDKEISYVLNSIS